MKKATAIVLAAAMTASLTACASNSTGNGESANAGTSGSSQVSDSAGSEGKVTVTFWDENAGDERTEYYQQISKLLTQTSILNTWDFLRQMHYPNIRQP